MFMMLSQEAICSSLEEYNQHIEELKQEMEEATESAKRIREDIQEMRNKYGVVDSQEKCAACDFPLLNRPFYLFLCGHMFHYDCLFQVKYSTLNISVIIFGLVLVNYRKKINFVIKTKFHKICIIQLNPLC